MEKFYKWIFGFSAIIYLLISVTTYHPDIRAFLLSSEFIRHGEVFTFYDHISKLPEDNSLKKMYGDDYFIYPPLAYLIPSAIYLPFSNIFSQPISTVISEDSSLYNQNVLFTPYLLFKLPSLLFVLLTFLYIPKLFSDSKKGKIAQILWILNPVTIFVSAGMGQVDTIIAFFILLSLINSKNKNYYLASIFAALSALIKPFGLILIPLIAIKAYKENGIKKSLLTLFAGLITWTLFIAPYLLSPAFKMYALLGSLASKTTFAGISVSGAVTIPWLYISYALIILFLFSGKLNLINSIGATILASMAFNHFHPQWFLWIMPWLIYYSLIRQKIYIWLIIIVAWVIIWISFDYTQTLGMFIILKDQFPPNKINPFQVSQIVLMARAILVSFLYSVIK